MTLAGDEGFFEQASMPAFLSRDDFRSGPIDAVVVIDGVFREGRLFLLEMATCSTVLFESSLQAVLCLSDICLVTVAAEDFVNDSTELIGMNGVFLKAKDRTSFI